MPLDEAIKKFVPDGSFLFIAGFGGGQTPWAACNEIIRQRKRGLMMTQSSFLDHVDPMIGAGCIDKIITSYVWTEIYGDMFAFRRALEKQIPHRIEIEDYSNFSMVLMLAAGAWGLPTIGVRSLRFSDIVKVSHWMGERKLRVIENPFKEGEKIVLLPPLNPDVCIIQAQRADEAGNVQAWGILNDSPMGANACKRVIACVEEIVDSKVIGKDPNRTIIPFFKTVAVIHCPWGSHPNYMLGYYDVDKDFRFYYNQKAQTLEGFKEFLDEWIFGVENRDKYIKHYIEKFGIERFNALKAKQWDSGKVNLGY